MKVGFHKLYFCPTCSGMVDTLVIPLNLGLGESFAYKSSWTPFINVSLSVICLISWFWRFSNRIVLLFCIDWSHRAFLLLLWNICEIIVFSMHLSNIVFVPVISLSLSLSDSVPGDSATFSSRGSLSLFDTLKGSPRGWKMEIQISYLVPTFQFKMCLDLDSCFVRASTAGSISFWKLLYFAKTILFQTSFISFCELLYVFCKKNILFHFFGELLY